MTEDRDATIVKRRRAGESFPAIAASFGKSGPWAWAIVKKHAPDLLGRMKGGVATAPRAPRTTNGAATAPRVTTRAERPRVVASVEPIGREVARGFHVLITVHSVTKHVAHGVDGAGRTAAFTPLRPAQLATALREAQDKRRDLVEDVPGHQLIRYDGEVGPWEYRPKGEKP